MEQRKANADLSRRKYWNATRLCLSTVPPVLVSLLRALDLAADEGWGFGAVDVDHVEATWELLDAESTAHGFVLSLKDGRRVYLQYVAAYADDELDEDAQMIAMQDERYPPIRGGGIVWDDDVDPLNRLLKG